MTSLTADCVVTAVAPGTVRWGVSWNNGEFTDAVDITVTPPVTSITASASATTVEVGQTVVLSATAHYSDGSSSSFPAEWTSSDLSIGTVESGTVTGVAAGTVTMTVAYGGQTASIAITVTTPLRLTDFTLSMVPVPLTSHGSGARLHVGQTSTITVTATYSDGSSAVLSSCTPHETSSYRVTANCSITALKSASTWYRATYRGIERYLTLVIYKEVSSFTASSPETTIAIGETTRISFTAVYTDGTSQSIYAPVSSVPSVATVTDSNWVTGVSAGTTTISQHWGGLSASIVITVESPVTITGVTFNATNGTTLEVGETTVITRTVSYSDGSSALVPMTCTLSSGIAATLSADCTVTAVAPGTFTFTGGYGGLTTSITITVELAGWTVKGYVNAYLKGGRVNNAVVRVGTSASATTNSDGKFELQVDQSGVLPIVVEASGFHKSESRVRIQSPNATTWVQRNIIPDGYEFDLTFFDHVFRKTNSNSLRGSFRWTDPPTVEIWTQELTCLEPHENSDYVCGKYEVTNNSAPSSFETNVRSVVASDVPMLTGGVVPGSGWNLGVTTKTHPPGTIFNYSNTCGPARTTIIAMYIDPGTSGISTRSYAPLCYPDGGGGMISADLVIKPDRPIRTYRHEMAHALGYMHPSITGTDSMYDIIPAESIMDGTTSRTTITRADKVHGYILYQRDPGFTSPDIDPTGSRVNLTGDVPWDPAMGPNPYREFIEPFYRGRIIKVVVP